MDDTAPEKEPADTASPAAGSTSSTPPENSPPDDPIAALGERILIELDAAGTNNTLVRWLAHHTAQLLDTADRARKADTPDAKARATEARAAILQLWQARSSWPRGWPPPRAAALARTLEALPGPATAGWYQSTLPAALHDIHHHVLSALVDLATDNGTEVEQGWLDTFGGQLTPDEAVLLHHVADLPQRVSQRQRHTTQAGTEPEPAQPDNDPHGTAATVTLLKELADSYRDMILQLITSATQTTSDTEPA